MHSDLAGIRSLRARFLAEMDTQIRYDARHVRGMADSYLLVAGDVPVAYGSVTAMEGSARDTVFECYIEPSWRRSSSELFRELLAGTGATRIECQSNDRLLTALLFEFAHGIEADTILFAAGPPAAHPFPGGVVRALRRDDIVFAHADEPPGDYVLEHHGEVVATGGYFTHYNEPYADLYMEVAPAHRRRGAGTYLVQELIARCYAAGLMPAARCALDNAGSRGTLVKAGLSICGFMLAGDVRAAVRTPAG